MRSVPAYPIADVPAAVETAVRGVEVFDEPEAEALNQARLAHLDSLALQISDCRVLDAGCGIGRLHRFFVERGCRVVCVDARGENIASLNALYPGVEAHVLNLERDSLAHLGEFDVVFCYGTLYHLEDPIAGLRNLAAVCRRLLLLETVVIDHASPVLRLVDEPRWVANQCVGGLAVRPSPAFVAMALSRIGFSHVYAPGEPPDHPDFRFRYTGDLSFLRDGNLLRCVFVASRGALDNPSLSLLLTAPAGLSGGGD